MGCPKIGGSEKNPPKTLTGRLNEAVPMATTLWAESLCVEWYLVPKIVGFNEMWWVFSVFGPIEVH